MNDLYVTLPSSVRSSTHENTLADYVSELSQIVELVGDWEVAIVEIDFVKSWYNVRSSEHVGIQLGENKYIKNEKINPGRYTEDQLVSKLNQLLLAHSDERVMESIS